MRPIAMPATGLRIGTPASTSASEEPHTEAIDEEPLDSRMSDTTRIVYGKSSVLGTTGTSARSASAPWPMSRRFGRRMKPAPPPETGGGVWAAHEAGLAHRERREVVVVPVELLRLEPEGVEAHLLLQRAERGDGARLRLAAGEERGAVRARRDADLDRDRADLPLGAAVGTALVLGDALADDRLLETIERE